MRLSALYTRFDAGEATAVLLLIFIATHTCVGNTYFVPVASTMPTFLLSNQYNKCTLGKNELHTNKIEFVRDLFRTTSGRHLGNSEQLMGSCSGGSAHGPPRRNRYSIDGFVHEFLTH